MTMRLDIVNNDAGEHVRREHARELGASVVVAIYRLARLAQMHDLGNQAFVRQLEQTHATIGEYCLRAGTSVNVLFAQKAVFIAGQLLKGSRGTYEAARDLAAIVEWCGGSELTIARDVTQPELLAFAEAISAAMKGEKGRSFKSPSPRIRLRAVKDAARLRGVEIERLPVEQRIVRSYANAVVVMRRFFDDLAASKYVLPRRIKRVAQNLVDLSDAGAAAFLGVTEARNQNHDAAGRAVNTAILAVAIAREILSEKATLAQIAMAAMVHDVGRPRAIALATAGGPRLSQVVARLGEDGEDRLPSGTAAVLTALGRINEPSITRTVIAYEALWLRRAASLGPTYRGARPPTLHARIVAMARRYNDLLTPEPGLPPPLPEVAIATLAEERTEPADRTVLRALVAALAILPVGTVVQLATGEVGEVIAPSSAGRSRVRVAMGADGAALATPLDVELVKGDDVRRVVRVMNVDGWKKGLEGHARPAKPAAKEESIPSRSAVVPTEPRVPVASPVALPDLLEVPSLPTPVPPPPAPAAAPARHDPPSALMRAIVSPDPPRPATTRPTATPPARALDRLEKAPSRVGDKEKARPAVVPDAPAPAPASTAVAEAMGRMIEEALRGAPAAGSSEPLPIPAAVKKSEPPISSAIASRLEPSVAEPPPEAPQTLAQIRAARPVAPPPETAASTARGMLGTTPLAHVLVYMLDHALSGSIVFREPPDSTASLTREPIEHVVCFKAGAVAKVKIGRPSSRIGDELVTAGLVSRAAINDAVEGSRRLGVLIGEYLVGHDMVSREALTRTLERQIASRVSSLVNLPPETTYEYERDVDRLAAIETEGVVTDPLNVILASVRAWDDRARIRATLSRIAKHPLTFHPDADPATLALTDEERTVVAFIREKKPTATAIFQARVADEEAISSLVYALAITRQFGLKGQKKGPMGERGAVIPISVAPPAAGEGATKPPSDPPPEDDEHEDIGRLSALPAYPSNLDDQEVFPLLHQTGSTRALTEAATQPPAAITDRPSAVRPTTGEMESAERSLEAMTHFRLAESALQRGDLAQAERLATRAALEDPDQADYVALHVWVRAMMRPDDTAALDAIDALSRVLGKDADNERALLYRGKLYKRTHRTRDALRDFERILAANPRHREAATEVRLIKQRAAK